MLDNSGTVSSLLTKQRPPHSEHTALVTEWTTLTHALSNMHVCVCMCVTEARCKRLVYCVACTLSARWHSCSCCIKPYTTTLEKVVHFIGFKRNLLDFFFHPSILNSKSSFVWNSWEHSTIQIRTHKTPENSVNWEFMQQQSSSYSKHVLSSLGQGEMAQHLEGTMD